MADTDPRPGNRLLWILGGAMFGAALSLVIGNTPIGIAITAVVGGVAGSLSYSLRRRQD